MSTPTFSLVRVQHKPFLNKSKRNHSDLFPRKSFHFCLLLKSGFLPLNVTGADSLQLSGGEANAGQGGGEGGKGGHGVLLAWQLRDNQPLNQGPSHCTVGLPGTPAPGVGGLPPAQTEERHSLGASPGPRGYRTLTRLCLHASHVPRGSQPRSPILRSSTADEPAQGPSRPHQSTRSAFRKHRRSL